MLKNIWFYISILLLIGVGFCFFHFTHQNQIIKYVRTEGGKTKIVNCEFEFVNPNRCEPELAKKKKEYVTLRQKLLDIIEKEKTANNLTNAAIYFRDLQNGPIVNINEQENFIPASLLKLPLLITYYKKAETDPAILEKKITIKKNMQSLPQNVMPEKSAIAGQEYTVHQLLTLLITESDNISWKALLDYLRANYSEEDFVETLSDLGIVDPRKRTDQQYITVQSYAALFRILYNSSYLSIPMSNKALDMLSKSAFRDGIEAGIPSDIKVANKFGEQNNGKEQQLHDCGIIYYPENPYVLCVMTRGYNVDDLEKIIKHISQNVYEEVVSRN